MRILTRNMLAILAGLTLAAAQAQQPGAKEYTLTAKFAAGDLLTYSMKMAMKMEPKAGAAAGPIPAMEMEMDMKTRMKTAGVSADGTGTLVISATGGSMRVNGMDLPVPETPAQTIKMSPKGVIAMDSPKESAQGLEILKEVFGDNGSGMRLFLPDKPVKVGDKWTNEFKFKSSPVSMMVESELLSVQGEGDNEVLAIKQMFDIPILLHMGADGKPSADAKGAAASMEMKMKGSGINKLLASNARIVSATADFSGAFNVKVSEAAAATTPFGSEFSMDLTGKMEMELLKAEKVTAPAPKPKPAVKPSGKKPGSV